MFVTNNSTKSRKGYLGKFTSLGLNVNAEEIYSSSYAAAAYLESINFPQDKKVDLPPLVASQILATSDFRASDRPMHSILSCHSASNRPIILADPHSGNRVSLPSSALWRPSSNMQLQTVAKRTTIRLCNVAIKHHHAPQHCGNIASLPSSLLWLPVLHALSLPHLLMIL